MGLNALEVEIANPATPETTERVELLIDSGMVYSVIPSGILERLGIQPVAEQTLRLDNGEKATRLKGAALFRYGGRIGGSDVLFGEGGDCPFLGMLTLGSLGLALDPLRRELRELPMVL